MDYCIFDAGMSLSDVTRAYGESISLGGITGSELTSQMNFSRGISRLLSITRLIFSTVFWRLAGVCGLWLEPF